jgi:membrane-bound lytic murein transglycosylase MltF
MLTYDPITWFLIKRNINKIQAMDMEFLRSIEGNNFLTELEDKQLQLHGQVKGMDRTGI